MNRQRQKRRRRRIHKRNIVTPDQVIHGIGTWDVGIMTVVIPSDWTLLRHSTSVLIVHSHMKTLEAPTDWKVERYIP